MEATVATGLFFGAFGKLSRITRFGGPPDYTIANLYYLKADLKTTCLA